MVENKKKTLEELAKEVMDTQMGLRSREELDALFAVEEPQASTQNSPAVEPTPAPTPPTPPAETPVQPAEPVTEGLDVLKDLPEEFRDKDVQTSVSKMSRSYGEIKAALEKKEKERLDLEKTLQSFTAPPQYQPAPVAPSTDNEPIDDSMFFEKPGETVAKVAQRAANQAVAQYHTGMQKAQFVNNFKAQHPDFDLVREEIVAILQARPDLDREPGNLPMVYNMAKNLKAQKMEALRQQLGLAPSAPRPTTSTTQSVDVDKIREEITAEAVEKAKNIILSEIRQRRGLSGIPGSTTPMTPQQRATPPAAEKPKTQEELIFEEMQNSGPKPLKLGD